jgi:1-acyl-sn-glycerol-3-phosphate acyltransferase
VRAVRFWIVATIGTILGWFFGSLGLLLTPRSGRASRVAERAWGRTILWGAGARLRVEGEERLRGSPARMIVANHASYLDPPALFAALPVTVRFVMKRELGRLPFLGWYVRIAHFLLDRSDPREGAEILRRVSERARRHRLFPMLFPEGTRSTDGRLAAFRTGAFQLALAGGFDVQPVAVLGGHDVLPKHARAPLRPGTVLVRVGEVIPVAGLEGSAGRKVLSARVREALLALGVPDGEAGTPA